MRIKMFDKVIEENNIEVSEVLESIVYQDDIEHNYHLDVFTTTADDLYNIELGNDEYWETLPSYIEYLYRDELLSSHFKFDGDSGDWIPR